MVVPQTNISDAYKSIVNQKVSLLSFLNTFSNEDDCLQLYFDLKFDGHNCKKCGRPIVLNYFRVWRKNKNGITKKSFRCKSCHTHIYPLSDTIFRNSALSLTSIFCIIFLMSDSKNNISAMEVSRELDVSYKTAHKVMMLIRRLLIATNKVKMKGVIEVDEAFIGKGSKVYNWSSISTRKQPIIGLIERDTGMVRVFLVKDRKTETIRKLILDNVELGSTIYTDSWRGYNCLSEYYTHESVDHSKREYVRGKVHTNSIENFWRHLKRNLRGVHIKITDLYVQEYVNEACWKRNSKGKRNIQLFNEILILSFFSGNCNVRQNSLKLLTGRKMSVVSPPHNLIAV